nr:Uncharacterised protein [Klebsiella pneumoniae]
MSVKTNAVLVCTLSLLLSACSGRASAPGSAEDAKISAEVDKILRDYQTGSDTSPRPMPHAIWHGSGGYLR